MCLKAVTTPPSSLKFPQFAALPLEIRLKILSLLLPPRRIVDVYTGVVGSIWTTKWPFDPIFHLCHDARRIAFKHYDHSLMTNPRDAVNHFNNDKGQRRALLDPRHDIIFLQDPEVNLSACLGILTVGLSPYIKQNLRILAVPYLNWRKARQQGFLGHLLAFKVLDCLFVPFMEESPVPAVADWCRAQVGVEIEGHVREVEREVMSDLEVLAMSAPEWHKPVLKVVRHRRSMAEILGVEIKGGVFLLRPQQELQCNDSFKA